MTHLIVLRPTPVIHIQILESGGASLDIFAPFLYVVFEKYFRFLIQFFSERLWIGDAKSVNVREASVPDGARNRAQSHDAANSF